jgi:putative serine protease PepD
VEFVDGEDEGREEEGPLFAWLPPEDRLWRHPSEMREAPTAPNPTIDFAAARQADDLAGPGRDATTGATTSPATTSAATATGTTATLTRPPTRVWTLALAAGLAGALFASGFFFATGMSDRRTTTVVEPISTPGTTAAAYSSDQSRSSTVGDWPSIASALAASIVTVQSTDEGNLQVGSGVLWAAGRNVSYILTAQDLVSGSGSIRVSFSSGAAQTARLVGSDPVTGVAVLATGGDHRSMAQFGSVSNVEVAEEVLAVGTRQAGSGSVVTGAVSGLDQEVTTGTDDQTMVGMLALTGLTVPATADGGALVDPEGEVVGIDTDITSTDPSSADVAYAVPIDVAEHVAVQLLAGRTATHPWLGIDDATDLTGTPAHALGVAGGAVVGTVDADSPASAAGIAPGDVITAFDGHPVTSSGSMITLLSQCQPGDDTTLTYFRDTTRTTVRITVGDQPADI